MYICELVVVQVELPQCREALQRLKPARNLAVAQGAPAALAASARATGPAARITTDASCAAPCCTLPPRQRLPPTCRSAVPITDRARAASSPRPAAPGPRASPQQGPADRKYSGPCRLSAQYGGAILSAPSTVPSIVTSQAPSDTYGGNGGGVSGCSITVSSSASSCGPL